MSVKNIKRVLVLFFCTILFVLQNACKKFIEVDKPIDQTITKTVFSNQTSAEAAVNGLYSQIVYANNERKFLNGPISLFGALSADELSINIAYPEEDQFYRNQISTENSNNSGLWRTAYSHIYHANILIENLNLSTALTESQRSRLLGEVIFIRALTYFYLVNLYGAVPLVLSSDYRINGSMSRATQPIVYQQIIEDLKAAKSFLITSDQGGIKTRVNKWAVTALLARVYLYNENFRDAILESSAIIGSGQYELTTPSNSFLANNKAAIFQFYPAVTSTYNAVEGAWFIPANKSVLPDYPLTLDLIKDFEKGDLRRKIWVDSNVVNNTIYYYPSKFKVRAGVNNTIKTEYNQVLRLGEQYLIRAESYAQQGNISAAIEDLDHIRSQVGIPLYKNTHPAITKDELLKAIFHERRIELFTEWGNRLLDLKRTNQLNIINNIKPEFKSYSALFPIPAQELLVDPFLTQNMGY